MGVKLNRFTILLWKNTLHIFRNLSVLTFVIAIPLACLVSLIFLQTSIRQIKPRRERAYPEFTVTPMTSAPEADQQIRYSDTIFYTKTSCSICQKILNQFMEYVRGEMPFIKFKFIPCKNEENMISRVQNKSFMDYLCGVSFADTATNLKTLQPKVYFPNELRTVKWTNPLRDKMFKWTTERVEKTRLYGDFAEEKNIKVGLPDYYEELALPILFLLDKAMTKYNMMENLVYTFNIESVNLPHLTMQRFTERKYKINLYTGVLKPFMSTFILVYFIGCNMLLLKMLSWEKQKKLKEYMHVAGLNASIYWLAWYVFAILVFTPFVVVIGLIFSAHITSSIPVLFAYSNKFVIFIILTLYMFASISFIFLISNIFPDTYVALRVGGFLYIFTGLPYYLIQEEETLPFWVVFILSFFFHMPMAIAFDIICRLELINEGATLTNVSDFVIFQKHINLNFCMIMLFCNAVLYLLIALYIHAVYPRHGVGKKWNFFLFFWRKSKLNLLAESSEFYDFAKNKRRNKCLIKMINLTKVKGKSMDRALNKVSIDIYEDELTVIYGQNASGKSTMAGILVGSILPTRGDIAITGLNLLTEREQIRTNIGYSPESPILFDYLTLEEHLLFFGYLRGLPTKKATSEMNFYIKQLNLDKHRKVKGKDLSSNVKMTLSLALALCGGPKIVILDEPTTGFGLDKLNCIWNLLRCEKIGRSIILMTHSIEETMTIADRIAIIKKGSIKCYGSKKFISACYNLDGYLMKLEKGKEFQEQHFKLANDAILKIIPTIAIEEVNDDSIFYKINDRFRDKLSELCDTIATNKNTWEIRDFAIYTPGFDQYFDRIYEEERLNCMENPKPTIDFSKYKKHEPGKFCVVFRKHVRVDIFEWIVFLFKFFTPLIAILILPFLISRKSLSQKLIMDEFQFTPSPIVLVEENHFVATELILAFIYIQEKRGVEVIVVKPHEMEKHYQDMQKKSLGRTLSDVLYGLQFIDDNTVKCWFNGHTFLHSSGLCASNTFGLSPSKIEFATFPSRFSEKQMSSGYSLYLQCFSLTSICLLALMILESYFAIYYLNEEISKFKFFQIICGLKKRTYWLSAFLWDMIVYTVIIFLLLLILYFCNLRTLQTGKDFFSSLFLIFMFGFFLFPKVYLFTYIYKISYALGSVLIIFYTIITVIIFFIVTPNIIKEDTFLAIISPYYLLGIAIFRKYYIQYRMDVCKIIMEWCIDPTISIMITPPSDVENKYEFCQKYVCEHTHKCCKSLYRVNYISILMPLLSFIIFGAIFSLILITIESYEHKFHKKKKHYKKFNKIETVYKERKAVLSLNEKDFIEKGIVLKNLNKIKSKPPSVCNIYLACEKHQCIGILGPSGSGKSLMFRVLGRETHKSSGQIWINNCLIESDHSKSKMFAYSPQDDTLASYLTVKYLFIYISQIKGYTYKDSESITNELADYFEITKYLNCKVKDVTTNILKQMQNALAFIGESPVLFFDQPTAGSDIGLKILFWRQLETAKVNSCILLGTNSLEECLTTSSKAVILYKGEMIWVDRVENLKPLFNGGVILQFNFLTESNIIKFKKQKESVINWMNLVFEDSFLLQDIYDILIYYIPSFELNPSEMFSMMEHICEKYNIKRYTMHEIDLTQMYSLFVTDFEMQHS